MKVKVGDTIFDGDVIPVMIILDPSDKKAINNMGGSVYCCYPENMPDTVIDKWMNETSNVFSLGDK